MHVSRQGRNRYRAQAKLSQLTSRPTQGRTHSQCKPVTLDRHGTASKHGKAVPGKGKGKTKTISKSKKAALEEAGIKVKPTSKRKTTGKRKATRAQATA